MALRKAKCDLDKMGNCACHWKNKQCHCDGRPTLFSCRAQLMPSTQGHLFKQNFLWELKAKDLGPWSCTHRIMQLSKALLPGVDLGRKGRRFQVDTRSSLGSLRMDPRERLSGAQKAPIPSQEWGLLGNTCTTNSCPLPRNLEPLEESLPRCIFFPSYDPGRTILCKQIMKYSKRRTEKNSNNCKKKKKNLAS